MFGKEGDVDLVLKTREKGRFYVKGGTEVGNGEGSAVRVTFCLFERAGRTDSLIECDSSCTKCLRRCRAF